MYKNIILYILVLIYCRASFFPHAQYSNFFAKIVHLEFLEKFLLFMWYFYFNLILLYAQLGKKDSAYLESNFRIVEFCLWESTFKYSSHARTIWEIYVSMYGVIKSYSLFHLRRAFIDVVIASLSLSFNRNVT